MNVPESLAAQAAGTYQDTYEMNPPPDNEAVDTMTEVLDALHDAGLILYAEELEQVGWYDRAFDCVYRETKPGSERAFEPVYRRSSHSETGTAT